MTPANELSASQARGALDRGEISAADLWAACLARIAERDGVVGAWCHIAIDQVQSGDLAGPLAGIPVGIKDIIDTADMPTTYGSEVYPEHQPAMDAACVALVRAAGGTVLGKTVSTEFAYFQPGGTANPHNPGHTPGGSSSGSAAAVADCMVPLAFGTQTGGSVIRPAAFCGVVGYKASYGAMPLFGVKALGHDLDSLGWFCRELADVHLMRAALVGGRRRPSPRLNRKSACAAPMNGIRPTGTARAPCWPPPKASKPQGPRSWILICRRCSRHWSRIRRSSWRKTRPATWPLNTTSTGSG